MEIEKKADGKVRPRPLYDTPYMFEAREFLRKKLIGKKVVIVAVVVVRRRLLWWRLLGKTNGCVDGSSGRKILWAFVFVVVVGGG